VTDQQRRSPFIWAVLFMCAVYALFCAVTVVSVARHFGIEKDPGWNVRVDAKGWVVSDVNAAGPAAGYIEPGDHLLALNGDESAAVLGVSSWIFLKAGEPYRVDLDRRGQRVSYELPMITVPRRKLYPIFGLCSLVFFGVGAVLAFARPEDAQVRLVGLDLMFVSFLGLNETLGSARTFLVGWDRTVYLSMLVGTNCAIPVTFHLFSRFPTWTRPRRPWLITQWLLYAALFFVFLPCVAIANVPWWSPPGFVPDAQMRFVLAHPSLFQTAFWLVLRPLFVYIVVSLSLTLAVTARNYQHMRDPGSRRRVRLVVAALIFSLAPYIGLMLAYRVMGWMEMNTFQIYNPLAFVAMLAIPVSIATAVWKEQLFDIRVLVRRGLQYLFARAALRALLVLPVALLLVSIFRNPNRTILQILTEGAGWVNLILIGAIAAALQSRQRFQTALDRRFFREAYEQEQVLVHLIDEVRQLDSLADIAKLVSTRIESVLHPTALHIFYRAEERSDRFEGHSSSNSFVGQQLSQQPALLRLIDGTVIRDFPGDLASALPAGERQWLENLGVRLIVPITGTGDRLVGVLLLGDRKSDEPYSATDRRLLQGTASQIGLVYENQHLKDRVRKDADVRRDVLARLEDTHVSLLKECPVCGACYDSVSDRCDKDGADLTLTLPIERTLDGKYRLERALGRGGFGAVFEATDLRLHRQVAAKVMMGSLFGDQTALRRFEREARAAARIDHRNITRVHDYGTVGSGGAYLIMELVAGRTWRAELKRSGVVAPARAVEWFKQLLDGLQFAHGLGIVHRDLKPENVMIVSSAGGADELKIMDFGLAKVLDAGTGATESVTLAGTAMGTLGYMAPETLMGGAVDERADIFAIGVMVVETMVGVRPFDGQSPQAVLTAILQREYRLPGESPEMRALDAIVQRCLAKDPRDRYGSIAELAKELVPALARCPAMTTARPSAGPIDAPTLGDVTR
jgi:eukaryotic-like serine/threonine-protein kinase